MATHASTLAWRTSRTEEPGGLPSMGSQSQARVRDYHLLRKSFVSSLEPWALPLLETLAAWMAALLDGPEDAPWAFLPRPRWALLAGRTFIHLANWCDAAT